MIKQYLGACAKCSKGTNNCPWISQEKVWLCSKHYREWLDIKDKHYQKAVKEFLKNGQT